MSEPIITPRQWLGRAALPPSLEDCRVAILGYCRFGEIKKKLAAKVIAERLFSHVDPAHQYTGEAAGRPVLAIECIYGGPMSATALEELAHYGIQYVIGFGYAGSLTRELRIGSLAFAARALVTDGTSREYLPETGAVYADPGLARELRDCAARMNLDIMDSTFWTTDALYREYPERITRWRAAGAQAVNMDTAHLYAVSRVVGIASLYGCVISDSVEGSTWNEEFRNTKAAMNELEDLVLQVAAAVVPGN